MEQELYSPHGGSLVVASPNVAFSPRSSHTLSLGPSSLRTPSPVSAAALSASQLPPGLRIDTRGFGGGKAPGETMASNIPSAVARFDARPRHSMFYMRDDMVYLEVEGCLYRVHKYQLERDSEYFRELFTCFDGTGMAGKSDATAIYLPDVTQPAFDSLLHFIYHGIFDPDEIAVSEWVTLLSISTQLQFVSLRRRAIREVFAHLSNIGAVETVTLAVKYDVPEWLPSAYTDLCKRPHPLDDLEAEALGTRVTARVARAREILREEAFKSFHRKHFNSRIATEFEEQLVARVIEQTFFSSAQ